MQWYRVGSPEIHDMARCPTNASHLRRSEQSRSIPFAIFVCARCVKGRAIPDPRPAFRVLSGMSEHPADALFIHGPLEPKDDNSPQRKGLNKGHMRRQILENVSMLATIYLPQLDTRRVRDTMTETA